MALNQKGLLTILYLIPLPPYLISTFSSWSFSHLWFASFKSFSIWRLCCLSSIWKLHSWRFDSFWEQKSLINSYFLHSVRHCEQLFWPLSSHFVMHSVWNTWPHGVEDTLLTGVNDSRQVEQAQAVEFISSFFLSSTFYVQWLESNNADWICLSLLTLL